MQSSNTNDKYAQNTANGVPVGTWSSGLFDCFSNYSSCCLGFWCPCIAFGRISEIVDKGSSSCIVNGAAYYLVQLVFGGACCISYHYRSKMRRQFNVDGNRCDDCLIHFWCETCALCQEYRELESRGFDVALGWQGNVDRQTRGVTMASTAPGVEGGMKR